MFKTTILYFTGRYWETVQRLKINQFYCAPTALRLLLKYGDEYVKKYDRSSLTTLGSGKDRHLKHYFFLISAVLLIFCDCKISLQGTDALFLSAGIRHSPIWILG